MQTCWTCLDTPNFNFRYVALFCDYQREAVDANCSQ
jgi:hypothetical protein